MGSAGASSDYVEEATVLPQQPTQDPQDKAFGEAAARDEEAVDELEDWGAEEDDLPDEPPQHPRAGGKAEPVPDS
jgi:hypothetical protein